MEVITMADVISLLGLPGPKDGRTSFNIQCPCCDDNSRKKHLNINLEKDVFRCPRCGFSGGMFDLYACYSGVDRRKARETLLARLNIEDSGGSSQQRRKHKKLIDECPITDIDIRDETYRALLDKLSLASDHKLGLLARGFTEEEIVKRGYKSMPVAGNTALAKRLLAEGKYLSGVPGFYHTDDGRWSFVHEKRGILIPARDPYGKIQGLQLRMDNESKRKFRWISSIGKQDGTKAECWTHLAGQPQRTVILTEGPMKADVIHHLTGDTVLAVPGVNSLNHLEEALYYLREHGTSHIMTAFDMDYLTNPNVDSGYARLREMLSRVGMQYGTYLWDPQYKGLDDYIWQHCFRSNRG